MSETRGEGLNMQLKTFINDILGRAKNLRQSSARDEKTEMPNNEKGERTEMNFCEDNAGLFQKHGMSTATARFIIERDVGERIGELFDVKDLTNTGRDYIAKIVRPDGSVIERLLVDKQNCKVHFPKGKYR
jgi:hypothetical protein